MLVATSHNFQICCGTSYCTGMNRCTFLPLNEKLALISLNKTKCIKHYVAFHVYYEERHVLDTSVKTLRITGYSKLKGIDKLKQTPLKVK